MRATDVAITAVPALRYRDLPSAIEWLCATLGFERQLIVDDDDGAIRYAQLTLGNSMVMLVPVRDSAFDELMVQPDEIGGAETQVCYFFVSDADAYHARVRAAGAEIVLDLADKDHRGRGFSCRDPEGHLWNFGSYDPWRHRSAPDRAGRRQARPTALLVGLSLTVIASLAAAGWAYTGAQDALPAIASARASAAVPVEADGRAGESFATERRVQAAEGAVREARAQLELTRSRAKDNEQAAADLRAALAAAASAREAAELARQQDAKEAAERALDKTQGKLALERSQRQAAERAVRTLRLQMSRSREATPEPYGEGITSLFESWTRDDG